jgi:hypothetical protein
MRGHHRSAMVALLVLAGMAGFATSAAADGAHGQQAPRMHFGDRVTLTTVCFSVTNPAGGQSTLYGVRYIKQGARVDPRTPAIVLEVGSGSTRRPAVAIVRLPNGRADSQAPGWSSSVTAPAAGSSLATPGPTTTSPR